MWLICHNCNAISHSLPISAKKIEFDQFKFGCEKKKSLLSKSEKKMTDVQFTSSLMWTWKDVNEKKLSDKHNENNRFTLW